MEFSIQPGVTGKQERIVKFEDTAANYGSGLLEVFATPALIALMEEVCFWSVAPLLPEGYTTVGTEVNVKHQKATGIGGKIVCETYLAEVDDNKLRFNVEVYNETGLIGTGNHTRFIINTERFLKKL